MLSMARALGLDTIVEGTRHCLEFAAHVCACKFLLTSSGAVYGKQPPHLTHVSEDFTGSPEPLDPNSAYAEGKRAAELLCALAAIGYIVLAVGLARGRLVTKGAAVLVAVGGAATLLTMPGPLTPLLVLTASQAPNGNGAYLIVAAQADLNQDDALAASAQADFSSAIGQFRTHCGN